MSDIENLLREKLSEELPGGWFDAFIELNKILTINENKDLSKFTIPYTGALNDLDLGNKKLIVQGYILGNNEAPETLVLSSSGRTGGGYNFIIGFKALDKEVNNSYGVDAIGNFALMDAEDVRLSSAIGSGSFQNLINGNYNLAVGFEAGSKYFNGTTYVPLLSANNCIYIGVESKSGTSNPVGEIVIGARQQGLGSNTTLIGNTATTMTIIRGTVGLGTTNPNISGNIKLDVVGKIRVSEAFIGNTVDNGYYPWDTQYTYGSTIKSLGSMVFDLNKGLYGGRAFRIKNNGVDVFNVFIPNGTNAGATIQAPYITNANNDATYNRTLVQKADGTFAYKHNRNLVIDLGSFDRNLKNNKRNIIFNNSWNFSVGANVVVEILLKPNTANSTPSGFSKFIVSFLITNTDIYLQNVERVASNGSIGTLNYETGDYRVGLPFLDSNLKVNIPIVRSGIISNGTSTRKIEAHLKVYENGDTISGFNSVSLGALESTTDIPPIYTNNSIGVATENNLSLYTNAPNGQTAFNTDTKKLQVSIDGTWINLH